MTIPLAAPRRDDQRRPALIVVVDTEEEFDWSAPFDRGAAGIGHLRRIGDFQALCEAWGVRPTYVVSYPVAAQALGREALGPAVQDGRALIGAHLHPWVSPPQEEALNGHNSFAGNLPVPLERAKLAGLTERIEASFGQRPRIYKAGRYGIGPSSFAILEELGFDVDLSPCPPFDFRSMGGPDFTRRGLTPEWDGPHGRVLSIPGTGALVGAWPSAGLYRLASAPAMATLRLPGLLARLGLVERIALSPEGANSVEMVRLVRWLHRQGQRLFVLSLHSPSVEPGHTPYVRSEAERQAFLATLERFLRFFMLELGGVTTDPLALHAALGAERAERPNGRRRPCGEAKPAEAGAGV